MTKPIAITMGDPAGVGPELIWQLADQFPNDQMLIFGDARLFQDRRDMAVIAESSDALKSHLNIVHIPCPAPNEFGQPNQANAQAVISSIEAAVQSVQLGHASALLTAPISKSILRDGANFEYPGHTEFLAALDNHSCPVMMLTAENVLRVVPVTIHEPLSEVSDILNANLLEETIRITAQDLEQYLGRKPRIWVAGLNPHAGENGHIGTEEIDWITPLITALAESGLNIAGPFSADTMFHEKARNQYDVAICMYHDQALIPIKTLAFDRGVNVTLGLSFLRTSPDHGTAFDIAGKNIANPNSMFEAYKLAKAWSQ